MHLTVGKKLAIIAILGLLTFGVVVLSTGHWLVRTQILSELKKQALWYAQNTDAESLKNSTENFWFSVNKQGHLIEQSWKDHFTENENLSHLPIVLRARTTEAQSGTMLYKELPGKPDVLGAFYKASNDKIYLSQIPLTSLHQALNTYLYTSTVALAAFIFIFGTLIGFSAWSLTSYRLNRLAQFLTETKDFSDEIDFAPEVYSQDEIGNVARAFYGTPRKALFESETKAEPVTPSIHITTDNLSNDSYSKTQEPNVDLNSSTEQKSQIEGYVHTTAAGIQSDVDALMSESQNTEKSQIEGYVHTTAAGIQSDVDALMSESQNTEKTQTEEDKVFDLYQDIIDEDQDSDQKAA